LTFKEIKKGLKKLVRLGVSYVVFSGGEPLLRKDLVNIVRFARKIGLGVGLQTNGVLITGKLLRHLGKMDYIQISLEGMEKEHNGVTRTQSFLKVVKAMKLVKQAGIRLHTNFTIMRPNMGCLSSYLQLLKGIGVDNIGFTRLFFAGEATHFAKQLGLSKEEMVGFLRELQAEEEKDPTLPINLRADVPYSLLKKHGIRLRRTYGCGAGTTEIAVQPSGDITPCPSDKRVVGNIVHDSFTTLQKALIELKVTKDLEKQEGCGVCFKNGLDPYSEVIEVSPLIQIT